MKAVDISPEMLLVAERRARAGLDNIQDAKFEDVVVESVPMPIALASPDEYWTVFTDMAAGIKEKIETLAPDEQVRLRDMVIAEAGRRVQGGQLRLEATPLCASARR